VQLVESVPLFELLLQLQKFDKRCENSQLQAAEVGCGRYTCCVTNANNRTKDTEMKLIETQTATIYTFEDEDCCTSYRVECIEGVVTGIARAAIEYYDDGDAENGPQLGSDLGDFMDLETSCVWLESHLLANPLPIFKDAEEYTTHLMMTAAHEDGAPYPSA